MNKLSTNYEHKYLQIRHSSNGAHGAQGCPVLRGYTGVGALGGTHRGRGAASGRDSPAKGLAGARNGDDLKGPLV